MRRMIMTALVLFPVMANAQATLVAKVVPPAAIAPTSAAATVSATAHPVVHEVIKSQVNPSFMEASLQQGGTLEYILRGSVPQQASAPKLTRAVELGLSDKELSEQPAVSDVAIRVTVDQYGVPRNLTIVRSAGKVVDTKALEAVAQYRFQPATVDNLPVQAMVTIDVKIQK